MVLLPVMSQFMSMENGKPLVTIVTPVYKGANYIEELILSIKNQTYPNIEHLIIDDGSPDDGETIAILQKYPHLRWWTRPNKGQYATLNEGFREAKGEWLTTISHDDRLHDPDVIQSLMDLSQRDPGADVVHGISRFINSQGDPLPLQPKQNYPYWTLTYNLSIYHCSLLVRTAQVRKHELYFDGSLKTTGDADWIMRMQLAGLKFSSVDRIITDYRVHPEQVTATDYKNPQWLAEKARLRELYAKNPVLLKLVNLWVLGERQKQKFVAKRNGAKLVNGQWTN